VRSSLLRSVVVPPSTETAWCSSPSALIRDPVTSNCASLITRMPTPFCVVIDEPSTRAVALRWLMLIPVRMLVSTLLRMSSASPSIMNTPMSP
jgi:hypothetical protein